MLTSVRYKSSVQIELLKRELIQLEQNIESTLIIFGSSRIIDPEVTKEQFVSLRTEMRREPDNLILAGRLQGARQALTNSKYYTEARKLGRFICSECQCADKLTHVVITGGGPGIMEATNRGVHD